MEVLEVFPREDFAQRVNNFLLSLEVKGEEEVCIKFNSGQYQFTDSLVLFGPNRKITLDFTSGDVTLIHHKQGGTHNGHPKSNRSCVYVLCREFDMNGTATWDYRFDKWYQYAKFIALRMPSWLADDYLPNAIVSDYEIERYPKKWAVEVFIEDLMIANQIVVDSLGMNKANHRKLGYTTGRISDRWFSECNHQEGGKITFKNNVVKCDDTELNGGMGIFKEIRFHRNQILGRGGTTGSYFGALFRNKESHIVIDLFESIGNYAAQCVSKVTAIGFDGDHPVSINCKKVVFNENVIVLDENPNPYVSGLRIKGRDHFGDVDCFNNIMIMSYNRRDGVKPRLASATMYDSNAVAGVFRHGGNILIGAENVEKLHTFGIDKKFTFEKV